MYTLKYYKEKEYTNFYVWLFFHFFDNDNIIIQNPHKTGKLQ